MANIRLGFLSTEDFRSRVGVVNAQNPSDFFQFVVGDPSLNLTVSLTGLSQDADLFLYRDTDGDGRLNLERDQFLARSIRAGQSDDAIQIQLTDSGSYIAAVSRFRNSNTPYEFRVATTAFPPTILLPIETQIGALTETPVGRFNRLSRTNTANTYRFTLASPGNFNAVLSTIAAGTNVDMRLIQDVNENGLVDADDGEILVEATASENQDDAIHVRSLAAGSYILQTYLVEGSASRYNLTLSNTSQFASNLLPVETDAGVLGTAPFVEQDSLSRLDAADTYQFTLAEDGNFNAALTGMAFGSDLDMRLIADVNNNGILDGGDRVLAGSFAGSNRDDSINVRSLRRGRYFLQTYLFSGGPSNYTLRLSNTGPSGFSPSNLLPTEVEVETLGLNPFIARNALGDRNAANTYRFTMLQAGNFNAALTDVASGTDLDMRLIQDRNNNGVVDEGDTEVLAVAQLPGNRDDVISLQSLAAGNYILQTYLFSGRPSTYTLGMSNTGRRPSNLLPVERSAGTLDDNPYLSSFNLSRLNLSDTYAFAMGSSGNFNASLTGIAAGSDVDMRLIEDVNGNGFIDGSDRVLVVANAAGNQDDAINIQNLTAGRYILQTYLFSGGPSNYTLRLSNTRNEPSNLLPVERNAGALSFAPVVARDVIGRRDAADTFRFTMLSAGNFNAALTGIEPGNDIDMRLIRDRNGNGVVDDGEDVLAIAQAGGNRDDFLSFQSLAAGNYILQTYLFSGDRSRYTLSLSNTGNDPSNLLPIEGQAGDLDDDAYLSSRRLSRRNTSDAYSFSMEQTGNFNASLTGIAPGSDIDMRLIEDVNNNGFIDGNDRILVVANAAGNRDDAINVAALTAGRYILQTYLFSGGPSRYTLRMSNTGRRPSNLLPVEENAGTLGFVPYVRDGFMGRRDAADTYQFTMTGSGNFNASLTGIAPGNDLDMRLIRDVNNNGVVDDDDEVIVSAIAARNRDDSINIQSLAAGRYILQTYRFSGNGSTYTLRMSNTGRRPSNLLPVERSLGTLTDTPEIIENSLSQENAANTYRFTMDSAGRFNAALTGITAGTDVDMRLIQDVNNNGVVDGGDREVVAIAQAPGNRNDLMSLQSLNAGNYILQTYLFSGRSSNYTLSLSNTGNDPSNIIPIELNAGLLDDDEDDIYLRSNRLGSQDTSDTYSFTLLQTGNFNASLTDIDTGSDIDMCLIQDVNNNGVIDGNDRIVAIANAAGNDDDAININSLTAGRYILQTYLFSGGPSRYTLRLSNTGLDPSNLLPVEQEAGTLSQAPYVAEDFVGRRDAADTYRFTMADSGNFNATLTNIARGTDVDMRLIADITNNGVVDEGDRIIARSIAGSNRDESINIRSLNRGNYILQTYLFEGDGSNYTLNMSNTGPSGFSPSNLLAVENTFGIVTDPLTRSGSVGVTDAVDTFNFGITSSRTVTLSLQGLQADADIRLIRDFNNNGIVDEGDEIQRSSRGGTLSDSITQRLDAGVYFAQVYLFPDSGNTTYSLTIG